MGPGGRFRLRGPLRGCELRAAARTGDRRVRRGPAGRVRRGAIGEQGRRAARFDGPPGSLGDRGAVAGGIRRVLSSSGLREREPDGGLRLGPRADLARRRPSPVRDRRRPRHRQANVSKSRRGRESRGEPAWCRQRRLRWRRHGCANRRAPDSPAGRGPRIGARSRDQPAQRRGEGQPVLSARIQSGPWNRFRDIGCGDAGEHAVARARTGLLGPEFRHPGAGLRSPVPEGDLFRRAGRLLGRGRRQRGLRQLARKPDRESRRRAGRLRPGAVRPVAPPRARNPSLRGRGRAQRRTLGPPGRHEEIQRGPSLQRADRRRRVRDHGDGLPEQMELDGPDSRSRDRRRIDLPVRRHRSDRWRRDAPLQPVRRLAAARCRLAHERHRLRRRLSAPALFKFHVFFE